MSEALVCTYMDEPAPKAGPAPGSQQDSSNRIAKQRTKALLTHCSASAYLYCFGIGGRKPDFREGIQEAATFQEDFRVKQESNWILKVHISEIPQNIWLQSWSRAEEPVPQMTWTPQHLCNVSEMSIMSLFEAERETPVLWTTLGSCTLSWDGRTKVAHEVEDGRTQRWWQQGCSSISRR